MTELTATAVAVMVTSLVGFLSLMVVLVFLWKVYKRGGRQDLAAAARAVRDARPRRLLGAADRTSNNAAAQAGAAMRRRIVTRAPTDPERGERAGEEAPTTPSDAIDIADDRR